MSFRKLPISWVAIAMLAACSGESAKLGSYITSDDDTAFMVQIASIEDGRVNGSVSMVTADENGKTTAVTRPLTGTIEGKALNLSVENGTGLSLVTGMVQGDNLRLTFFADGNSTQMNLAKSDAGKFEQLANAKRHRAAEKQQGIETAAAMKNRVEQRSKTQKSIDQLADTVFDKTREVQEKSRKIEDVLTGYRAAYDRVSRMQLAKRRQDNGSPEAEYRVTQIDNELDSISNDLEGSHDQVQYEMQSLSDFMSDTTAKSSQILAECVVDQLLNCSRLSVGMQTLRVQYQKYQGNYARENAAFKSRRT